MSVVWAPGFVHDLGDFAGYQRGRNRLEIVKVHATAKNGAGNITVGKRGYFQFYLPKVGPGMQFAPVDALCWDSAEFNDDGPGVEFEREGTGVMLRDGLQEFEPLTPDQLRGGAALFSWLHAEHGFPLDLYDGPRYQATPHFRGFVNHGDLDAARSDGVTRDEWAALTGAPISEEFDMLIVRTSDGHREAVIGDQFFSFRSLAAMPADRFVALDGDEWDYLHSALAQPAVSIAGGAAQYAIKLSGTAVPA